MAGPAVWKAECEAVLRRWRHASKLVLTVDHADERAQVSDAYGRARRNGFVPYVADRELGRLRINAGFEPGGSE